MKRTFILVLLFLLISNVFSIALADAVPYASTVFDDTGISINHSSGKITALAKVESNGVASKLGIKSLSIQVLNGSSWTTVASVSDSYAYNTESFSKTLKYTATSGKTYRSKVTFYGKVNGVSETLSMTSSTKTAP